MIARYRFREGMLIFMFACIFITPLSSLSASGEEAAEKQGISIEEATLRALENNQAFQIERINPEIQKTYESEEKAVFDPVITLESNQSKSTLASGIVDLTNIERKNHNLEVSKMFSTGTEVSLGVDAQRIDSERSGTQTSAAGVISLNQPILKGFGRGANLANLRRTQLALLASEYELRGFAENMVADVETTCWDYVLAQRRISIVQESLKLAEDQLDETRKRIKIGKLASVELYAAEAEVALRKEALINARTNLSLTRLKLQRLLNNPDGNPLESSINITDNPTVVEADINEIPEHIDRALKMRPEINQARLDLKQDEIEIVRTKNGLLPVLDFFITIGKTGYSDSFGDAFKNINDGRYNVSAGISFNFPIKKRADRAKYNRSILFKKQTEEALKNLEQLIEVDVRSAMIEINRANEQVSATAATRKLQEESLRAETEKFRVGKSTALLVARAQRDFTLSQLTEIEAVISYLKATINLYQQEGTLLTRRGIAAPGDEPVTLSDAGRGF
jgi:outer membrane protein